MPTVEEFGEFGDIGNTGLTPGGAEFNGVLTVNDTPTPVTTRQLTVYVKQSGTGSGTLTGVTIRVTQSSGTRPYQTLSATSQYIVGSAFAGAVFTIKNDVSYNVTGAKDGYTFLSVAIFAGDEDVSANLVYSQPLQALLLRVPNARLYLHENCFTQEAADDTTWRNGGYYYMYMSHVHLESMAVRVNGQSEFVPCTLSGDYYSNSGGNFTNIETTGPLVNLLPGYTSSCLFDLKFTVSRPGYETKEITVRFISQPLSIVGQTVIELQPGYPCSQWANSASTIMFREEGKLMTYENFSYLFLDMIHYGSDHKLPIFYNSGAVDWTPELFCSNLVGYSILNPYWDLDEVYVPEHCISYFTVSGGTGIPTEETGLLLPFLGINSSTTLSYATIDSMAEAQSGISTKVLPVYTLFAPSGNLFTDYIYTDDEDFGTGKSDPNTNLHNRVLRFDRTLYPKPMVHRYSVDTNNGQWIISGNTGGTTVYMSKSGHNIGNSSACCYVDIDYVNSLTLHIYTSGESNYDFVVVSQIDKTPTRTNATGGTTGNHWSGYGKASGNYYSVVFNNIPGGHHRITIAYMKDGSVNTEPDCGKFYISASEISYY